MCLGIPGEVVDVRDDAGLRIGTVRFAGITRDVCLDYVPDAAVGEYVLVHVGFAISKIDPRGSGAHVPGPGGAWPDGRADRRPGARGDSTMKYLDEYRDGDIAGGLRRAIADTATRPWVLMEVCGGQTHSIVRYGIDRMLPPTIELVHGPGCPGLRHPARDDRPRARDRAPPGRDLHVVRRHAARAGLARRPAHPEGPGRRRARRVLAARRAPHRARQPAAARRVLRDRLRDHGARERDGRLPGAAGRASTTSRCSCRTCSCRRRWRRSSSRRTTACRRSSVPATCAPSWAAREYEALARATACRSWSRASSRSTCWKAS